jgi:hypothetical protein
VGVAGKRWPREVAEARVNGTSVEDENDGQCSFGAGTQIGKPVRAGWGPAKQPGLTDKQEREEAGDRVDRGEEGSVVGQTIQAQKEAKVAEMKAVRRSGRQSAATTAGT